MRPQATVMQPDSYTPEVQQHDRDCHAPKHPPQPPRWKIGEVLMRSSCPSQQGSMLLLYPHASFIKKAPAAARRVLSQCALVADIVVDDPFPPESRGRIGIKPHPRPRASGRQNCRRSRIKADPTRSREVSLDPGVGVTGSHHILPGEIVEFTSAEARHHPRRDV